MRRLFTLRGWKLWTKHLEGTLTVAGALPPRAASPWRGRNDAP